MSPFPAAGAGWRGGLVVVGSWGWPGNKVFECENDCCCVMFTVASESEQQITLSGTHPCGMEEEEKLRMFTIEHLQWLVIQEAWLLLLKCGPESIRGIIRVVRAN